MPVDRVWTVPEDPQRLSKVELTQEGDLLIQPRVVRDDDYDGLQQAILEAIAILRHVGGIIQIASQRGEIAQSVIITESYIFAYNSFTPLVRRLEEAEGNVELTEEEMARHFPDPADGQLGDVLAQAEDEERAGDPAAAAAAVE